jgi:hypothetical protein
MGGMQLHDAGGTLPTMQLMAMLGTSVVTGMDVTTMFIQICVAFLCARAAMDFAELWRHADEPPAALTTWHAIAICWLSAFSPVLAWRLGYGHEIIVLGCFALLATLSLVLRARLGSITLTHACVAVAALIECLSSLGQQTILCSIIFGGPICLVLMARSFTGRAQRLTWLTAALLVSAAIGISMPKFAGVLAHATGPDAGRTLGGESVTYSYVTSTVQDWLSSIPWGTWLISDSRTVGYHHEVNFPVGPLILLVFLAPWRRMPAVAVTLLCSVSLVIALSMNLEPVSTVLLKVFSPLNSFRVPARAILPLVLLVPILASAAVLHRVRGGSKGQQADSVLWQWVFPGIALVAGYLFMFGHPNLREAVSWIAAIVLITQVASRRWVGIAAMLFLGLMSVSFFHDRLLGFAPSSDLTSLPDSLGNLVRAKDPSLAQPLTRVNLTTSIDGLAVNTPFAAGLFSVDGYGFPSRRYVELISAVTDEKLSSTTNFLHFDESSPAFPFLQRLYNVKETATLEGNQVHFNVLGPTPGPAWFGSAATPVPSFDELGKRLKAVQGSALDALTSNVLIVSTDASVPDALAHNLPFRDSRCEQSKTGDVTIDSDGQTLHLQVTNALIACPLVVSQNFVSTLEATSEGPGSGTRLLTFPAYGALTGIWVPPGVERIRVRPVPVLRLWATVAQVFGLVFFFAALYLQRRYVTSGERPSARIDPA